MTRPRVPENKRQRTARACDSCKRRKQKCNGLNPCNTCMKRNLFCEYTDGRSPPKFAVSSSAGIGIRRRRCVPDARTPATPSLCPETASTTPLSDSVRQPDTSFDSATRSLESQEQSLCLLDDSPTTSDAGGSPYQSIISETDDDEDVEMVRQFRMLEDDSNRLFYLGDSSSYAFVQLIRMIVDNAAGPSPFTLDPQRHKMLDSQTRTPLNSINPYILPGREVADLIVRSFSINTHGIIDIFDRRLLDENLKACYTDPLSVGPSIVCCVYLVLAVGLAMAAPAQGSMEESAFRRLQSEQPLNRAEALFGVAKYLADPMNGADESDLWVIQARILMTLYLMITNKTTAAYSYCGMAVRSACALGLHRTNDTMSLFMNTKGHPRLRWNIWRSLFVLDRFLAVSLGRPCAISEDDFPYEDLELPPQGPDDGKQEVSDNAIFASRCLDSAVKSARSLGQIIRGLYSKDTVSTKLAQSIVDDYDLWSIKVHPFLSSENIFRRKVSADRGIAILYIYLLHYHSILLLTRPFFVHLIVRWQTSNSSPSRRAFSRIDKFSQSCVAASTWSVSLVKEVYDAGYLPRRNPFILYFLFSAAVVILSNEFSGLYQNNHFASSMTSIFRILDYCAETDAQAPRMLYILRTFHSAVEEHLQANSQQHQRASSPVQPIIDNGSLQAAAPGRRSVVVLQSSPPMTSTCTWRNSHPSQHSNFQHHLHNHGIQGPEEADGVDIYRRTSTQPTRPDAIGKTGGFELDFGGLGGIMHTGGSDEREEYIAALHLLQAHLGVSGGYSPDPRVLIHGHGAHIFGVP